MDNRDTVGAARQSVALPVDGHPGAGKPRYGSDDPLSGNPTGHRRRRAVLAGHRRPAAIWSVLAVRYLTTALLGLLLTVSAWQSLVPAGGSRSIRRCLRLCYGARSQARFDWANATFAWMRVPV